MKIDKTVGKLFGVLVVILLAVEVLPLIFEGIAGMAGVESEVPSWLTTVLTVIVGAGMVFMVWKLFDN